MSENMNNNENGKMNNKPYENSSDVESGLSNNEINCVENRYSRPSKGKNTTKKTIVITSIITAIAVFALTTLFYLSPRGYLVLSAFSGDNDTSKYLKFRQISKLIDQYYIGEYDENYLIDNAYYGYVASLGDVYSSYLSKSDFESFNSGLEGDYKGIGITVSYKDNKILVVEVNTDSPAQKSGIEAGDYIIAVNGTSYSGSRMNDAIDAIKATEVGETVRITIEKNGVSKDVDVTVEEIIRDYIKGKMLDSDIGYIKIDTFGSNIGEPFKNKIDELTESGMKSLILDLRANPGGALDSAVAVGDILLPEGNIITIKDKNGKSESYKSDKNELNIPIFVLINEGSASASEVIAGALRDYDKAVLIGTKTYGKGVVQSIFNMSDGTGVKLTTAKYYTPSGECIHGKGIEPDIPVEIPEGTVIDPLDITTDIQLQRAITEAKKKLNK